MQEFFQKLKKDMMLSAIFQIVAGLLLVLMADRFLSLVCTLCGACLLAYGIYHMVRYMRGKKSAVGLGYDAAQGIFGIAAGIFVLMAAELMIKLIFVIFGAVIVFESIVKLQDALDMRKLGHSSWLVMAVLAVVMAVLGLLIILRPSGIVDMIVTFAGIVMLLNGVVNLIDLTLTSSKSRKY